jgi:hypothetical protein
MNLLRVAAAIAALSLAPASVGAQSDRGEVEFERAMVGGHNAARAEAGVPPIRWDAKLAADAAIWAEHLAQTHRFEHSTYPRGSDPAGEGENLWMGSRDYYSYRQMVGTWIDEERYFVDGVMPNLSRSGNWRDVGHYTQIIWRGTTRVGCALASNERDDYLVCRYSPPGNVMGSRPR